MSESASPYMKFDLEELRTCLGGFVTGVTVITTLGKDGNCYGLTANSFSSVSLEPPLILWSQQLAASSYPVFREAKRFAVNILSEHQVDISKRFASKLYNKFEGVAVRYGKGGVPLIEECASHIECSIESVYPGGDHAVFLGRVEEIHNSGRKPLAFGGGKYMVVHPHDLGAFSIDLGIASPNHIDAIRFATPVIEELSRRTDKTVGLAVWGNRGPTMIRWEESSRPLEINLRAGLVLPLMSSATGHVFAAFLPGSLVQSFYRPEMGLNNTHHGGSSADQINPVLEEVRLHGMSRVIGNVVPDINERAINAFSAPVFNQSGELILAFTMMGHADVLDGDWNSPFAVELRQTALQFSRRLGYQGDLVVGADTRIVHDREAKYWSR